MNGTVTHLWRYPIKGVGTEALTKVALEQDRPLPLDRAWAVLESGRAYEAGWQRCVNFLRGAKAPSLMAVTAETDGATLHLRHPELPPLTFTPNQDNEARLFEWLAAIYPKDRAAPAKLVASPPEGMADVSFASVSIMNQSSLRALSQKAGADLDMRRFRGNVWVDGLAPWEEFDLIGKTLTIGNAKLEIMEPITRCRATEGNPKTGRRDVDTLKALEQGWGHRDFGVNAIVRRSGEIAVRDEVHVS